MEVKILIPPDLNPGGKTDLRDWTNHLRSEGKTREEILAAMRKRCRLPRREEIKQAEKKVGDAILDDIGIEVIGTHTNDSVEVYSPYTRKFTVFTNVAYIKFANLILAGGSRILEKVLPPGSTEQKPGTYTFENVRNRISVVAAEGTVLPPDSKRGAGVWDAPGGVVCVGDKELAILNGTGAVERSVVPRHDGHLYNLTGNPPWYDHDRLSSAVANASCESDRAAVDAAEDVLGRWRYEFPRGKELAVGLILATWIQKIWRWRPQVVFTGGTQSGKSVIMEAIRDMFCGLAGSWSQSTTPIGIIKHCRSSSRVMVLDELDKNRHRKEIYEQCVRPAGRGEDGRLTGEGKDGQATAALNQIFLLAGIDSGISERTDADRVVRIELKPKLQGVKQINLPSKEECRRIGFSLLVVAIRHATVAMRLAVDLGKIEWGDLSVRVGQTYAVPAAIYSLATGLPGEETLSRFLVNSSSLTDDTKSDQDDLIENITMAHVHAGTSLGTRSVGQLLEIVTDKLSNPSNHIDAEDHLRKVGIWVSDDMDFICLHADSVTEHLLKKGKFGKRTVTELIKRIENATPKRSKKMRWWEVPIEEFGIQDVKNAKDDDF